MASAEQRTVRDLRRGNRTAVLRQLYFDGPLSRQELGPATGLSSGSDQQRGRRTRSRTGSWRRPAAVDSDGGRPRTLLRVARRLRPT